MNMEFALTTLRLGIAFLTRLPVGELDDVSQENWRWYTAAFPVCGWILGVLCLALPTALLRHSNATPLHALLIATLCVSLIAYMTRGLHLDGFADLCDALGGGYTAERRLEILKDSTVGSFAAVGLSLLLITKVAALAVALDASRIGPCIGVVVLSRLSMGIVSALSRYPRSTGTAAKTVGNVAPRAVAWSLFLSAPVLLWPEMLGVALVVTAAAALIKWQADRALGGVTGDVLGACCEICETAGFMTVAFMACP